MNSATTKELGFDFEPYLKKKDLTPEKLKILHDCQNYIHEQLSGYNLDGVAFTDVSAGGIQIQLTHRDVKGFMYVDATFKYDFSDLYKAADRAIAGFKQRDNPESVAAFKHFIEEGMKYGFD